MTNYLELNVVEETLNLELKNGFPIDSWNGGVVENASTFQSTVQFDGQTTFNDWINASNIRSKSGENLTITSSTLITDINSGLTFFKSTAGTIRAVIRSLFGSGSKAGISQLELGAGSTSDVFWICDGIKGQTILGVRSDVGMQVGFVEAPFFNADFGVPNFGYPITFWQYGDPIANPTKKGFMGHKSDAFFIGTFGDDIQMGVSLRTTGRRFRAISSSILTGNAPTQVFTIPLAASQQIRVKMEFHAVAADGVLSCGGQISAVAKRVGAAAPTLRGQTVVSDDFVDFAAPVFSISGNNLILTFTGAAGVRVECIPDYSVINYT